jgi:DNA-binding NarL/FixJ family response regulator
VRTLGSGGRVCDDCLVGVTVLIVDDHAAFRSSARRLLENEGFDVVGEAEDGETGLMLALELEPELVLLDVGLPGLSGYDVAERLAGGRSKVVLVSSRAQEDFGRRVRESGAAGFISKDRLTPEGILALVRAA